MNVPIKSEKLNNVQKKNDEIKQEQADSSNVVISLDNTKKLTPDTNNSDVSDSNEAKAKEIDTIDSKESNVVLCIENSSFISKEASYPEKAQALENDKTGIVLLNDTNIENDKEVQEKCVENVNNLSEEKNSISEDIIVRIKENEVELGVKPEVKQPKLENLDDEDNIQDEELDHEVDEEEIKGINDNFNQTDETVSLKLH